MCFLWHVNQLKSCSVFGSGGRAIQCWNLAATNHIPQRIALLTHTHTHTHTHTEVFSCLCLLHASQVGNAASREAVEVREANHSLHAALSNMWAGGEPERRRHMRREGGNIAVSVCLPVSVEAVRNSQKERGTEHDDTSPRTDMGGRGSGRTCFWLWHV